MKLYPQHYFLIRTNKQKFSTNFARFTQLNASNDIVSFSARRTDTSIDERMSKYAVELLKEYSLKRGQPVYIKGNSYYLPFMEALSKEAYKMESGHVHIEVIEPQLEKLKEKYNK